MQQAIMLFESKIPSGFMAVMKAKQQGYTQKKYYARH